jgi:hypothetical protein
MKYEIEIVISKGKVLLHRSKSHISNVLRSPGDNNNIDFLSYVSLFLYFL